MNQSEFSVSSILITLKSFFLRIILVSLAASIVFICYSYTIEEAYESRAVLKLSEEDQAQSSSLQKFKTKKYP